MKLSGQVKICSPSRLHLGLISMARDRYRKYGGIGFAIQGFDTIIEAHTRSGDAFEIHDLRPIGRAFSVEKLEKVRRLLEAIARAKHLDAVKIEVLESPAQNSGFGSGTSLELACIEALFLCNDRIVTAEDIVNASTRGCTSGVGIKTYFQGGLVFDLGVPAEGEFLPSSASAFESDKSVLSERWQFPEWELAIFLPMRPVRNPSGVYEEDFFEKNSPIDEHEVYRSAFLATFGVLSAALSVDKGAFARALTEMQGVGWKKLEWTQYGETLSSLRDLIQKGATSGLWMSSMGPATFCLAEALGQRFNCPVGFKMHRVLPNNTGRVVERC